MTERGALSLPRGGAPPHTLPPEKAPRAVPSAVASMCLVAYGGDAA
jgi:hypothetical protein